MLVSPLNRCKPKNMDTKEYLKEWRKNNPTYHRDYMRKNLEKRLHNNKLAREWFKNHPDYMKERRLVPEVHKKMLARTTLNNNIIMGKITRQYCEISGCNYVGEAHHDNYERPLDVKWLCKKHHEEYHSNILAKK